MHRQLRAEKLRDTAAKMQRQIAGRFPGSGLANVAAEVVQVAGEALVRAESISRPNRWLRGALVLLAVIAVAGVVIYIESGTGEVSFWRSVLLFLDDAKGSAAILTATAIFLFTYETRIKRKRALRALHELRAIAHIVDMHQLAKDPDMLDDPSSPVMVDNLQLDAESMGRYLHFCTELLAVTSKIGQLYIQDFPDAQSVAAVDQFENLATGLSSKIWQKLMILDVIRTDVKPDAARLTSIAKAIHGKA